MCVKLSVRRSGQSYWKLGKKLIKLIIVVSSCNILVNGDRCLDGLIKTKLYLFIDDIFTDLQWHLFQQFNKYQDVLYTNRNIENSFELRYIYALHALNHIYK